MDPFSAVLALAGLVGVSTVAGLVWRARDGRLRSATRASAESFQAADFGGAVTLAPRATLVQFSTEYCSRCPSSERMLRSVASAHSGIGVAVVDLTHRSDLTSRFRVTQTPTVLVLDGDGRQLARSGGVPSRTAIEAVLPPLSSHPPRSNHVPH